ncbi:hypothetical protein K435DRAFT_853778 [Dendrothele bispora CBS 962.96]|uniref:CxC2-like cysteine cluster KDZ transposase-associated domain-containing protein n=1 Tax=Dendrothele bispora (strain CBS 962.96) TaxID=1314807 RepID=A0A4S8MGA1_DENBC|nr:hypothetical protein K435DRAFT_853778 [Dendrothele bispora CBS 962.96]
MGKRKQPNFFRPPAATQHKFGISNDGRRFVNVTEDVSQDQLSSDYEGLTDHEHSDSENSCLHGQLDDDFDYYEDGEAYFSVWDHDHNLVATDSHLQNLSAEGSPDSAHIWVSRSCNLHSDNPTRAWLDYRQEYLDVLLWLEGRCEEECFGAGMFCSSCIVESHSRLPLHWIERWNGQFFEASSLRSLGLRVQLGHGPRSRCINPKQAHSDDFAVIHVNGIHSVAVNFCGCPGAEEHYVQLLRSMWYPATLKNPQTATTFSCLRQFQNLNCLGKLPVYDYYKALEIMTQNRQREVPKDRYRVLLRVIFQWRHLKMLKRAGRCHAQSGIDGTARGECAMDCPACPQPEKNLPDNWKEAGPEFAFLYTLFIAIDANFRDGFAYIVPSSPYKEHIKQHVDQEDMSSCSGFQAMFLANSRNVQGLRFTRSGVRFMVPKFHLRAHQPDCHTRFNFDYAPGCGETHGEVIEEGWAQSNKAAAQTKEMGPGTRAQTLDDIFGFHNFRNIVGLDKVLAKRLVSAAKEFDQHYRDFKQFDNGLERSIGRKQLNEWDKLIRTWEKDHDAECPYEEQKDNEKDQYKLLQIELMDEETRSVQSGTGLRYPSSPCHFLSTGIDIQDTQRSLELFITTNKYLTPTQHLELQKKRSNLLKRITQFRTLQRLLMPGLADVLSPADMRWINDPDISHPEKIPLFLPSSCGTASARSRACIGDLPGIEAKLRRSEAYDALEGIRDGLRVRTMSTRFKLRNITGQVESGRAGGILRQIDIKIHSRKIRYRLARAALSRLWGPGDWEKDLKELKDEDVRGINERALNKEETAERRARIERLKSSGVFDEDSEEYLIEEGIVSRVRGESRRTLSWIWYDIKDDSEFQDAIRVEWCKAQAQNVAVAATWWKGRKVGEHGMRVTASNDETAVSHDMEEALNAYATQQSEFARVRGLEIQLKWKDLIEHAKGVVARQQNLQTLNIDLELLGAKDEGYEEMWQAEDSL